MDDVTKLRIYKTLTLTGSNARLSKALEIRRAARASGLKVTYRSYFVGVRRIFELTAN